jgi:hypothetical protein
LKEKTTIIKTYTMQQNDDEENIRKPDIVIREQLIPDDNDWDLPTQQQTPHTAIMDYEMEYERAIMESIEEFKEIEKQKRREEMREITMRIEKLKYTTSEETTRRILLSIIHEYIDETSTNDTKTDEDECTKAKQFMQDLYSVPLSKNRKPAITKDIYTIIMSKLE